MHSARGKGGASFPLQVFLHLSRWFSFPWFLVTLALLIYKGVNLPYPQDVALPIEIVAAFLVLVVQWIAVNVGKKGNLTESPRLMLLSIVLLVIVLFGIVYFMWLQTYVMRLDLGVSATFLCFEGLAFVFSIVGLQNTVGDGIIRPSGFSS
jgi:transmembrane protein 216